jgi:hypothetical protein
MGEDQQKPYAQTPPQRARALVQVDVDLYLAGSRIGETIDTQTRNDVAATDHQNIGARPGQERRDPAERGGDRAGQRDPHLPCRRLDWRQNRDGKPTVRRKRTLARRDIAEYKTPAALGVLRESLRRNLRRPPPRRLRASSAKRSAATICSPPPRDYLAQHRRVPHYRPARCRLLPCDAGGILGGPSCHDRVPEVGEP